MKNCVEKIHPMPKSSFGVRGFFLLFTLLLPSILFAAVDPYDTQGHDENRESVSAAAFEHIDPFTGGLYLSFEDMRLPGNGGLDMVVQHMSTHLESRHA